MRLQHTEKVMSEAELESSETRKIAPPEKKYGVVSVCAGAGIAEMFRDLGVDQIVSGGQTMNPSTEDILKMIDATPAEIVIVLPNNKNILMAAEQCKPLSDKQIVVIPTATVPQGITAMLNLDPSASVEENVENMTSAIAGVTTMQITYAARNSDFDGYAINAGDYLALCNGALYGTDPDIEGLLRALAEKAREPGQRICYHSLWRGYFGGWGTACRRNLPGSLPGGGNYSALRWTACILLLDFRGITSAGAHEAALERLLCGFFVLCAGVSSGDTEERSANMNILYAVSEAYPFAKNGGLGDVAGSYPVAMAQKNVDIRVILPLYDTIPEEYRSRMELVSNFTVQLALEMAYCGLYQLSCNGVVWYFVENEYYFHRGRLYGCEDDDARFAFFSKAVCASLRYLDWCPEGDPQQRLATALFPCT